MSASGYMCIYMRVCASLFICFIVLRNALHFVTGINVNALVAAAVAVVVVVLMFFNYMQYIKNELDVSLSVALKFDNKN